MIERHKPLNPALSLWERERCRSLSRLNSSQGEFVADESLFPRFGISLADGRHSARGGHPGPASGQTSLADARRQSK